MQKFKETGTFLEDPNLVKKVKKLNRLAAELERRAIPEPLTAKIDAIIVTFNQFEGDKKAWKRMINDSYNKILGLVKSELGITLKGHFQTMYLGLGMTLGLLVGTFTFVPFYLGPAIGLLIGMIIGQNQDNQQKQIGKQINLEE